MEYVQMTLNDWVQMKQKLKQELLGVKQSFVRIGYALRKIEDQRLYEQDGYKSIAEFAKAEYGLEPSTTSRFMSINREYSVDGYSETLRPEFADLGRSQLEEMLKLPDSDRQMIQPETSREDIRELKRFNKAEPAAGVADDIHQLVEKFYKDNPDILNEVFSEPEFEEQTIKRFAEIVNPGGNRSYKKGLFFLMMYESRVAVKKFGDTPQDMTWWQFYLITMDIFGQAAAGPKTWQKYFGGEDSEETENEPEENGEEHSADNSGDSPERNVPADDTKPAERAGRGGEDSSGSGTGDGADNIQPISADEERLAEPQSDQVTEAAGRAENEGIDEPEADGRADGENGTEDEPVDQKGAVGNHGAVSETGAGEKEDDTAGEESSESDCQKSAAGETAEPAGAESQGEEIAPAQKSAEILESEASDEAENGENCGAAESGTAEPETEAAAGEGTEETELCSAESGPEVMNAPEIINKPFGTRKDYMDTLTAYGMAIYMAEEYERHTLKASSLAFPSELEKWLLQEVDENGRTIEEA